MNKNQKIETEMAAIRQALALAGICPRCGADVEPKEWDGGKRWKCNCGMYIWLSNGYIQRLKSGKKFPGQE